MAEFRMETYRILDITQASEYLALSAENKAWYDLFMSCGVINLETGSLAQEKLWGMFDENSNTGKELRDPDNRFVIIPQAPDPV